VARRRSRLQNDGADALSSAPFGGISKSVTIVTNGPTDIGQAGNFATANASTLDPLYVMTGTANLPQSQVNTVVTDGGGSATSTNGYTLSGGSLTAAASTASAPSQGATTYTASGLPTAAGTVANIALFPCTGTSQAGNNTTNGAPTTSGGTTTFTAPGGTSPTGGNAIGQGTSSSNSAPATSGFSNGNSTGSGAGPYSSTAYVASVNGVPTANGGGATNSGPTQVYGVSPSSGTLTFVVNSFQLDCVVPVVYTAPASAGSTPPLLVNANGSPQSGYTVGVGGPTAWSAPAAPSSPSGYVVDVVLTAPLTPANTFDGLVVSCNGACPAGVNAGTSVLGFKYGTSGRTYYYTDGSPLAETSFASYLSAANSGQTVPGTSTTQAVAGDLVAVGTGTANGGAFTGYASGAPASFAYDTVDVPKYGDVPAAPTSPNAAYNGCAFTTSGTCQPGVVVSWTPPANPDVSGGQAIAATNAQYNVWRATSSSGTLGAATKVGTVSVIAAGTPDNMTTTSISSPEFIDTSETIGTSYVYYVTAVASSTGGSQQGPFSAATSPVVAGAAVGAATISDVAITPSNCTDATAANCKPGQTTAAPATTGGYAVVTYNEAVTCLTAAGGDFKYSNSAAGGAGVANEVGASCGQGPAANKLIIQFPTYTTGSTVIAGTTTTTYTYQATAAPVSGDSFSFTAPSSPTTATAVFAGQVSSPVYAASQTVTDNGQINGPNSVANPLNVGPVIAAVSSNTGTNAITLTYNEKLNCSSVDGTAGSADPGARTNANGDYTLGFAKGSAAATPSATPTSYLVTCTVNTHSGHASDGVTVTTTYDTTVVITPTLATPAISGNTFSVVTRIGTDGDTVTDVVAPTANQDQVGDAAAGSYA